MVSDYSEMFFGDYESYSTAFYVINGSRGSLLIIRFVLCLGIIYRSIIVFFFFLENAFSDELSVGQSFDKTHAKFSTCDMPI